MKTKGRRVSKNLISQKDTGQVDFTSPERPKGKITQGTLGKLRKSSIEFEEKEFKKIAQRSFLRNRRRAEVETGFAPDPKDPYKMKPYAKVSPKRRSK